MVHHANLDTVAFGQFAVDEQTRLVVQVIEDDVVAWVPGERLDDDVLAGAGRLGQPHGVVRGADQVGKEPAHVVFALSEADERGGRWFGPRVAHPFIQEGHPGSVGACAERADAGVIQVGVRLGDWEQRAHGGQIVHGGHLLGWCSACAHDTTLGCQCIGRSVVGSSLAAPN